MPRVLSEWTAVYLLQVLLTPPSNYDDDTSSLLLTLVPAEIMAVILMIVASRDCNAFLAFVLSSKAAWSLAAPVANDLFRRSSCCGSWENARVACAELRSVLAAERFLSSGTVQDFDSSMSRLYQKLCLSTGFCGVVDDRFLESEALLWANDARPVVIKKRMARGSSAVFHALDIKSQAASSLFEPLRVAQSCSQNIVTDHLAEVIGFDADQISLAPVRRNVVDGADMFVVAGHFALFSVVRMDQGGVVEEHEHKATFQTAIKRHSLCALQTGSSSVADVLTACLVEENVEFRWQYGQRGSRIHSLDMDGYFVSHSIFVVGSRFCEWGVRHVSVGAHIATFMCRMLSVDMVTGEVDVGACSTANLMLPNTTYFSAFQCMEGSHPALVDAKPHYTNDGKIKFVLPFLLEYLETANVTLAERSRFRLFTSMKHILVSADVTPAVDIQISTSTAPLECLTGDERGALYDVAFTASGRFGAVTHTAGTTFFDFHGGLVARRTHHSRIQPVVSFGKDRFCIQTDDTVFVFEKIISKIEGV